MSITYKTIINTNALTYKHFKALMKFIFYKQFTQTLLLFMALVECSHKFYLLFGTKIMWVMLIKCGGKKKGTMSNVQNLVTKVMGRGANEGREENSVYLA
jgi:hypothetical protein